MASYLRTAAAGLAQTNLESKRQLNTSEPSGESIEYVLSSAATSAVLAVATAERTPLRSTFSQQRGSPLSM